MNFPLFLRALLGVSASYVIIIFTGAFGRLGVNGLKRAREPLTPHQVNSSLIHPVSSATKSPVPKRTKPDCTHSEGTSKSSHRQLFQAAAVSSQQSHLGMATPLISLPLTSISSSPARQQSRIPRRHGPQARPLPSLMPVQINNIKNVKRVIDNECTKLCSVARQVFRSHPSRTSEFSWKLYADELSEVAPVLWAVLEEAATSASDYRRKSQQSRTESDVTAASVLSAAILLKNRNMHLSSIQHWLSLMLWHGNSSTMVSII